MKITTQLLPDVRLRRLRAGRYLFPRHRTNSERLSIKVFVNQDGATLIEYAIAFTLLVLVFVVIAVNLRTAATDRGVKSMEVQNQIVPCSGNLGGQGRDAECY